MALDSSLVSPLWSASNLTAMLPHGPPGHYDSRINPERKKGNHIRQLEALGYLVTPAA